MIGKPSHKHSAFPVLFCSAWNESSRIPTAINTLVWSFATAPNFWFTSWPQQVDNAAQSHLDTTQHKTTKIKRQTTTPPAPLWKLYDAPVKIDNYKTIGDTNTELQEDKKIAVDAAIEASSRSMMNSIQKRIVGLDSTIDLVAVPDDSCLVQRHLSLSKSLTVCKGDQHRL